MPDPTQMSDNPLVQKLLDGSAPPPIKLAAARGALPISAEELSYVLYALRGEPDPELQKALHETIRSMGAEALANILRNPELPGPLFEFYAHHTADKPQVQAAIVQNRGVSPAALQLIAVKAPAETVELLVTNQVALIRTPELMDTLLANPNATADQKRRVEEVREEFVTKREREEARKRDEEERLARLREKKDWSHQDLEKLTEDLAREARSDLESGRLPRDQEEATGLDSAEDEHESAYSRILNMSVPEKVLLAIRGSRAERNLLIKDSNRLVATSAIKSPKISDKDVEYYAGLRNISDEILRFIGSRREWLKSYSIVHTLVKNPRTPLAIALNLLPRLQARDLKILESDRNVSETLRRQAKQIAQRASGAHR